MKIPWLCFAIILLLFTKTFSQDLQGKILTYDGKPAIHATVKLERSKKLTYSDSKGFFSLHDLIAQKDLLLISYIGAKTITMELALDPGENRDLGTIQLEEDLIRLQNVEITGRTASSYKSDYSFYGNKTKMAVQDIPQSISSVTKEVIQDKMEFTLKEALEDVPGLNQYSGYDEYTIRGFHADNSHDINGLRSYNTAYTNNMLVNIERIEVIKGPTASLYGNCDPGGTINLVTKKPLEKFQGDLQLYGGSWNHLRVQGDVTGPLNKVKSLLYRLNAGFDTTRSFRKPFSAQSFEVAPSVSFIPGPKLQLNLDLSLSRTRTLLDRGQPGFKNDASLTRTPASLSVSQPGDYLRETKIASVLSASYKFNSHLSVTTGYLHYITRQKVADHGLNDYLTADSVSLDFTRWNYNTVTNTVTSYMTYNFGSGQVQHQLLAGYDYLGSKVNLTQQFYEDSTLFGAGKGIVGTFSLKNPRYLPLKFSSYSLSDFSNDGTTVDGSKYHTKGIYVQDEFSYRKMKVLLSLREEIYKGDDTASGTRANVFLPRVGLVYSLHENLNVYATYNQGFDPFEASSTVQVFNAPFKPVTSQLLETGLKGMFFQNRLSASVALYQLTLHHVAVNAGNITNPDLFVQQGKSRSRGLEAEAAGDLARNLSVSLSYSFCDAKVIQSKVLSQIGQQTANSPKNTTASWFKYDFQAGFFKGFSFLAGHSAESRRATLEPGLVLPGYFTIKAGAHFSYHHIMLGLLINNLTNKIYWTGAYNNVYKWPGEPRNAMLNLGYRF